MEELKKKSTTIENDKEIVFSKAIKAGKRIYYLDVKKNRKEEMFIAITESKKVVSLDKDDPQVNFEKHKIFLYKEDFEKFMNGLQQAIDFIGHEQGTTSEAHYQPATATEEMPSQSEEIKIDIDFYDKAQKVLIPT